MFRSVYSTLDILHMVDIYLEQPNESNRGFGPDNGSIQARDVFAESRPHDPNHALFRL